MNKLTIVVVAILIIFIIACYWSAFSNLDRYKKDATYYGETNTIVFLTPIIFAPITEPIHYIKEYLISVADRQEERKLEKTRRTNSGQDNSDNGVNYSAIIIGTNGLSAEEKQKILNNLVEKNEGGFYSITWGE